MTWMRKRAKQPEGLISVVLNSEAPDADRDDAASDLGEYDEPEAEAALLTVATDPATENNLADSAGESLAEIWLRSGSIDAEKLGRLTWPALRIFIPAVLQKRRDWEPVVRAALLHRTDIDWRELGTTVGDWFVQPNSTAPDEGKSKTDSSSPSGLNPRR